MKSEVIKEEIEFLKYILFELERNPDVFVSMRIDVERRIKTMYAIKQGEVKE